MAMDASNLCDRFRDAINADRGLSDDDVVKAAVTIVACTLVKIRCRKDRIGARANIEKLVSSTLQYAMDEATRRYGDGPSLDSPPMAAHDIFKSNWVPIGGGEPPSFVGEDHLKHHYHAALDVILATDPGMLEIHDVDYLENVFMRVHDAVLDKKPIRVREIAIAALRTFMFAMNQIWEPGGPGGDGEPMDEETTDAIAVVVPMRKAA
jgi:hypothetical protein